ncbi:MAG: hypothetical protein LC649_05600 [Bacteroidales bacterium]|nr:hypothetical protein [Bacteroidales bacterium]
MLKDKGDIYIGKTAFKKYSAEVKGCIVELEGEKYYKISNYHQMPDFFMTVVSDSDHWMYISSNGSLSAGRKNRDNALFPYYTVDKIHDYRDKTGSKTACLVNRGNHTYLWEPFASDYEGIYRLERNLYKSISGNKILFEENNLDLELSFRYGWYNSEQFGWIKKSVLENNSENEILVDILDGIRNILPYGTDYAFQNEYSNLLEAYRKSELLPESKLGLFLLSSIPVDRAEPSEALKATVVWSVPPDSGTDTRFLISDKQLENFRAGGEIITESDILASRGAYYINNKILLKKNENRCWYLIADINKDSTDVVNLDSYIKSETDLTLNIENDIAAGTVNLVRIVAGADGLQTGKDELITARHFSNTLFNVMRGGVFINSYRIDASDFRKFIVQFNREVSDKFSRELENLPDSIHYDDLIVRMKMTGNPDLERICYEYLPLAFSRRHGDPSRPWNQFSIETKNEDGSLKLDYQGNWRDIFQNWEALTLSYPEYIESIICKFVNATTADGYNPYRLTRSGMDWERPDPDDPWSFIGYWGDHQVIYIQKFLEQSENYHPGKLDELLTRKLFVYANVPYRIKNIDSIIANPKDTILFDGDLDRKIEKLTGEIGADAKLLTLRTGEIHSVNLMEKILCPLLSKLSNFIPEAGIWLNTQRPEWNDANNALVGNGVSMVTLYYLRRSVSFWQRKLAGITIDSFNISAEVFELFEKIFSAFEEHKDLIKKGFSDSERFSITYQLGKAGSDYRESIYANSFSGEVSSVSRERLVEFMQMVLAYFEQSIDKNRRADGLYHSYNLVSFGSQSISVRNLYEMLEGQVAVLSSGYLDTDNCLVVLDALRASKLYRTDQESYLLYPFRVLPEFIQKNLIAPGKIAGSELLQRLMLDGNSSIVTRDITGNYHFNGIFRNSNVLSKALESLDRKRYGDLVRKEKGKILEIYESVFDHQSFTGRSGTFYGYEGLGSIYWHMVSKLLLATQERFIAGEEEKADLKTLQKIRDHYFEIRKGLGTHKSPALHGAFPIDAYSHTPAGAGARQPGLTGQVKEDIIARFGELGVRIRKGSIVLSQSMLNKNELLNQDQNFYFLDAEGKNSLLKLHSGQFAFTLCQVPVVYARGTKNEITIWYADGSHKVTEGFIIDEETSNAIFRRSGEVRKIEFTII